MAVMRLYDQLQEIKASKVYDGVSGIYFIKNTANGNMYIGSSLNLQKRFKEHESSLRLNKHHSIYLQRAYNKYGDDYFVFGVLEFCEVETLKSLEQKYLDGLNPKYNVSIDAVSGMRGRKHTTQTRNKIKKKIHSVFTKDDFVERSKRASEYSQLPDAKKRHLEAVKNSFSSERLQHMRDVQKELWNSEEYKNRQIESHRNYSEETKKKFSDAQKKLWSNPEYKEKASKSRQGKGRAVHTPDEVIEIRKLHFELGLSARKISEMKNEPYKTIRSILYDNWKWLK